MLDDNHNQLEQKFESAQHDVQYLPPHLQQSIKLSSQKESRKINSLKVKQDVHLKFQRINLGNSNNERGYNKKMSNNISFQTEKSVDNYYNQQDFDNQDGRSHLGRFYQDHQHAQLIYKKSKNIGTGWIRNSQYYTSIFVNPQNIWKYGKKNLYGKPFQNVPESSQETKYVSNYQSSKKSQIQPQNSSKPTNLTKNTVKSTHGKQQPLPRIQFDSDFQSGNLYAAYKIGVLQYDLLLQNDINTKGNTQWFYFRIRNLPANKNIKINIVNFRKSDSLFNYGMLPCYYSAESQKQKGQKWIRKGQKVKYFRSNHPVQNVKRYYYTLTFTISTQYSNDIIKIAQCYPYTLKDLNNYLNKIMLLNNSNNSNDNNLNSRSNAVGSFVIGNNKYKNNKITVCTRVTIMNKTLGGNRLQGLVIKQSKAMISNKSSGGDSIIGKVGNNSSKNNSVIDKLTQTQYGNIPLNHISNDYSQENKFLINLSNNSQNSQSKRPIIIVMARQHPGQTPGSFIMQGFINYLLSKQKDAQFLRRNYQFRLIPLINPDGVEVGNYRTNLYGVDLNRRWDCITKPLNDKKYQTNTQKGKNFFPSSKQKRQSQQNYRQKLQNPVGQSPQIVYLKRYISSFAKERQIAYILDFHGHSRKLYSFFYGNTNPQSPQKIKIFPYICSKLTHMIRYEDCTFNLQEQKRSTARIQFLMNYKVSNIYTFEASFYGYINGKKNQKKHFTQQNYRGLGTVICKGIYLCEKSSPKYNGQIQSKEKILYDKWYKELVNNKNLIKNGQDKNSGSESCPEECEIMEIEKKLLEEDQEIRLKQEEEKRLNKININLQNKNMKNINFKPNDTFFGSPQKSLRQMQVLQIAQVNSVFPNDVLALVPNTFYLKSSSLVQNNNKSYKTNIKKQLKSKQIQTQPCQIVKIYGACKIQEIFHGDQTNNFRQNNDNNIQTKILMAQSVQLSKRANLQNSQLLSSYINSNTIIQNSSSLIPPATQKNFIKTPLLIYPQITQIKSAIFQRTKSKSIGDVTSIQQKYIENVKNYNNMRRNSVDQILSNKINNTYKKIQTTKKRVESRVNNDQKQKQQAVTQQLMFLGALKQFSSSVETSLRKNNISSLNCNQYQSNSISMGKTIHQKQLYQNARHMAVLKKSTDIRRHFKKILNDHQIMSNSKPLKGEFFGTNGNVNFISNTKTLQRKNISNSLQTRRPVRTASSNHHPLNKNNFSKITRKDHHMQTQISFTGESIVIFKDNQMINENLKSKQKDANENFMKSRNKRQNNNKVQYPHRTLQNSRQGQRQNFQDSEQQILGQSILVDDIYQQQKGLQFKTTPQQKKRQLKTFQTQFKQKSDNCNDDKKIERFWTVQAKRKQIGKHTNLYQDRNAFTNNTALQTTCTSKSRNQFRKSTLVTSHMMRNKSNSQYQQCEKIMINQRLMENWKIKKKSLI